MILIQIMIGVFAILSLNGLASAMEWRDTSGIWVSGTCSVFFMTALILTLIV